MLSHTTCTRALRGSRFFLDELAPPMDGRVFRTRIVNMLLCVESTLILVTSMGGVLCTG